MSHILEQLFAGEIYPDEQILPDDPIYRLLESSIAETSEKLKQNLSTDDAKQLELLNELYQDSSAAMTFSGFTYGFRLAAKIMCDVFYE